MYKIAESKCDSSNKSDRTVCQACLSTDRKLYSVGEFVDIFMNISNNSHNVKPQACLCWECMALLKKIKLFTTQLEDAQNILRRQSDNKQKPILLTSLSKLTISTTENVIITITHNDDDDDDDDAKEELNIKQIHKEEELNIKEDHEKEELNITQDHEEKELNIKHEHDDSNDDFNFDQNDDFYLNKEEKKEKVTRKKNYINNKKMSQYKIVSDSTKKVGRKKFSIKNDDPKIWLERERNTDFYKDLRFKCDFCVRVFANEKKLNKHLLRHDKSAGRHTCPTCTVRYSTETALHSHMRSHKCGWQCNRCDFRCYSGQRMSAHINTHKVVQCVHCDAKFPDVTTFYLHYKALHTIFLCDYCGKRCKTKYSIEKHIKIHHMVSHSCATCGRNYKSICALRKHIGATHATVRAYCVACDKHYRSHALYRRHVLTSRAHGHERDEQSTKTYSCPECTNTYSRRAFMMNHYRHVHTNQSKHHCEHCDKRFLNRTKYVDHMRYYHEGVKREKNKLCTVCGKGFAKNPQYKMDIVQNNNNRDAMNNEVSSTSSEDTNEPVKRYTKLYKKHYNESAVSDNEIQPRNRSMQARNYYKSTGNLSETYRDFRSLQNSVSSIDLSLHREDIKKFDSLQIPIVGYEIMEERARFTIYKLKVEDDNSDQSWLVFRRYTDFVRLYSRIKTEQPNLNLPLPGKRWFRDNFEPAFLEDRVRGLQIFVNAILSKLPNHPVVREFFCLDEPPQVFSYQPEVQAVYGALEDSITTLKMQLKQKDATIAHLQKRLAMFEAQVKTCGNCSTNLSM